VSANDNLSHQFMYHHAPVTARGSIRVNGLQARSPFDPSVHEDESYAPTGVYLQPWRNDVAGRHATDTVKHGMDLWRVDTAGLHTEQDPDDQDDYNGFRYSPHDIGPERISLARSGHTGHGLGPLGKTAMQKVRVEMYRQKKLADLSEPRTDG